MYRIVNGVTLDVGVPSIYLVYLANGLIPGHYYVLVDIFKCTTWIMNVVGGDGKVGLAAVYEING